MMSPTTVSCPNIIRNRCWTLLTPFDVAGCFLNAGSTKVSFSQATANSFAEGPYCLTGYSDDGCGSSTGSQTFEHVPVANRAENGVKIILDGGVASGSHKKWTLGNC
jgi:hypothetical protein